MAGFLSAEAEGDKSVAGSKHTAAATKARMKRYDAHVRKIRRSLQKARHLGVQNSQGFVEHLNLLSGIPAPNGKPWNKNSVLRALRRLKARGLDEGSLPAHLARYYV